MATNSKIQWTDATWNCITGCTRISAGCAHCYAGNLTRRLKAMGQPKYAAGFDTVICHPECLAEPLGWAKPRMVFVNSMADTFHKDVPDDFVRDMIAVMQRASQHRFQVLTKRADRLPAIPALPGNVWLGVTVESSEYLWRVDCLRQANARVKFLSLEPLLGDLSDLDLSGIDWVILGGESGPGARRMEEAWVRRIRDLCATGNVPFFFKQWGSAHGRKHKGGRILDGRVLDEMPQHGKDDSGKPEDKRGSLKGKYARETIRESRLKEVRAGRKRKENAS